MSWPQETERSKEVREGNESSQGRRGSEKPHKLGNCRLPKGLNLWGGEAVKRGPEEAAQEATERVSLGGGQKVNFLLSAGPAKACPGPLSQCASDR